MSIKTKTQKFVDDNSHTIAFCAGSLVGTAALTVTIFGFTPGSYALRLTAKQAKQIAEGAAIGYDIKGTKYLLTSLENLQKAASAK